MSSSKSKARSVRRKGKGREVEGIVIRGPTAAARPVSSGQVMYLGPISVPRSMIQEDLIATNAFYSATLSSNGIGVIATSYTNDPTNCYEWANLSAVWDEFRVIGFDLEFFPNNRYSKTLVVCTPGVGVIDHANTAILGSLGAGLAHGSARLLSLEDPWSERRDYVSAKIPPLQWRMASTEEAVFTATSATLSNSAIKLFFGGLSNTTQYGLIYIRFLIQFRGRS